MIVTEPIHHSHFVNFDLTGKPIDVQNLPFKLLKKMKLTQTDGTEERHSNNMEDYFGSIWSLKSKVSLKSPDMV